MEYKEIQSLIKLIDSTDLTEFKLREGEFEILIRTKDYYKYNKSAVQTVPLPAVAPMSTTPVVLPDAAATGESTATEAQKPASAEGEKAPAGKALIDIKSPIVGTFYRSPSPDKEPYIKIGDQIHAGDIVCIVEAMKLFNEIESEVSGKLVEILVDDATPVEYDQVLFRVQP